MDLFKIIDDTTELYKQSLQRERNELRTYQKKKQLLEDQINRLLDERDRVLDIKKS